jgi:energy-coupling factor transporter ATP-binding protein EcfA2
MKEGYMHIRIRNIGVIQDANIDLRPLTVFVGPNNSGKTWVAYSLAAVLGHYGLREYVQRLIDQTDSIEQKYPELHQAITQLIDEGNARINLVDFAHRYGEQYFHEVSLSAREWLSKFIGTKRVSFPEFEIKCSFAESKDLPSEIYNMGSQSGIGISQRSDKALLRTLKESEDPFLYFYTETKDPLSEKLPYRVICGFMAQNVFFLLPHALHNEIRIFPTERTTFITYPFNRATSDESSKLRDLLEKEEAQPRLAPVYLGIFLGLLHHETFERSWTERQQEAEETPEIQNFIDLASLLEEYVLGGTTDLSPKEPDPKRELLFQASENVTLDMAASSSMVKELAPLVLYLRYVAKPRELLVIDEPEMNLHPEAQVKFMEFLALLIEAGLNVLITTHSSYMVDHLVNLMKAAKHPNKEEIQDLFFLQKPESFISQDDVSVYLFEKGEVKNILDEEGMIDWRTFSNVSERVSDIFFEI